MENWKKIIQKRKEVGELSDMVQLNIYCDFYNTNKSGKLMWFLQIESCYKWKAHRGENQFRPWRDCNLKRFWCACAYIKTLLLYLCICLCNNKQYWHWHIIFHNSFVLQIIYVLSTSGSERRKKSYFCCIIEQGVSVCEWATLESGWLRNDVFA